MVRGGRRRAQHAGAADGPEHGRGRATGRCHPRRPGHEPVPRRRARRLHHRRQHLHAHQLDRRHSRRRGHVHDPLRPERSLLRRVVRSDRRTAAHRGNLRERRAVRLPGRRAPGHGHLRERHRLQHGRGAVHHRRDRTRRERGAHLVLGALRVPLRRLRQRRLRSAELQLHCRLPRARHLPGNADVPHHAGRRHQLLPSRHDHQQRSVEPRDQLDHARRDGCRAVPDLLG